MPVVATNVSTVDVVPLAVVVDTLGSVTTGV